VVIHNVEEKGTYSDFDAWVGNVDNEKSPMVMVS
jgi:hypothetical protein